MRAIASTAMVIRFALMAWLLWTVLAGCGVQVHGHIPPSTFQFKTVVAHDGDPRGGGWKVAQVIILLSRISMIFPANSTCLVQVGVPVVNHMGPVPDELAQIQSARAADRAARAILRLRLPTAVMCDRFRSHMKTSWKASYAEQRSPGSPGTMCPARHFQRRKVSDDRDAIH